MLLTWLLECLVVRNAWLTYPWVAVLGVVAAADQFGEHTVPLLTWRALVLSACIPIWLSLCFTLVRAWRSSAPYTGGDSKHARETDARAYAVSRAYVIDTLPLALLYLMALVQIQRLSMYDGAQTQLDSGSYSTPFLSYLAYLKLLFLFTLQSTALVYTCTLAHTLLTKRRHP